MYEKTRSKTTHREVRHIFSFSLHIRVQDNFILPFYSENFEYESTRFNFATTLFLPLQFINQSFTHTFHFLVSTAICISYFDCDKNTHNGLF